LGLDSAPLSFGTRKGSAGLVGASSSGRLSHHEVIEVLVRREQACQALARVEHPSFHGVLRQVDDLSDLLDDLL
jgi:hypothetical protein